METYRWINSTFGYGDGDYTCSSAASSRCPGETGCHEKKLSLRESVCLYQVGCQTICQEKAVEWKEERCSVVYSVIANTSRLTPSLSSSESLSTRTRPPLFPFPPRCGSLYRIFGSLTKSCSKLTIASRDGSLCQ